MSELEPNFDEIYAGRRIADELDRLARHRQVGIYEQSLKRKLPCPDVHTLANMIPTELTLARILESKPELTFADLKELDPERYESIRNAISKYQQKYFYPLR